MAIKIKGWMTYQQVAEELGLEEATIRRYVWNGVFEKDVLEGSAVPLISEDSVKRFKLKRRKPGNPNFGKRKPGTKKKKSRST